MIELKNINKIYPMGSEDLQVLYDVSLLIDDREFVAIIGPSGSGKSTLMNIIGCLDVATSGAYLLDGQDISQATSRELATLRNHKIGFIFQQFNLLQKLSAFENVELPMIYQGVPAGERAKRAEAALERVGLADRMKHRPNELSGGQQQRVAIARALVTRPSLILADEPTGNLDSKSGREIMQLMHELHGAGNTIVLITHDSTVAKEADRRIRISDGRVVMEEEGAA